MTPSAATHTKLAQLHPDLAGRVEALILASPFRIGITSAWRSSKRQAELYAGWKARRPGFNPANPPGTSKHEREQNGQPAAEAADLNWFGSDEAQRWAHRHAPDFGLCFPIRREDWHVESNGKPWAPAEELPQTEEEPVARIISEDGKAQWGFDGVRVWHAPSVPILKAVAKTGVYGPLDKHGLPKVHLVPAGTIKSLLEAEK